MNKNMFRKFLALVLVSVSFSSLAADRVILISVDGLRPDIINKLGEQELPGFYRFKKEGAWTDNARTDFNYTRTLPNHSSMITGRPVLGARGHGQISNDTPPPTATLHNNKDEYEYVSSAFDVAHDHGLSTALYVSKDKFILFPQSYGEISGAEDTVDEDNGTNKIDRYVFLETDRTAEALITKFVEDARANPADFSFVHIVDTDSAGHGDHWTEPVYENAVRRVDSYLQNIFALVDSEASMANTTIILVADHGGTGSAHGESENPLNFTIPFYIWGADVAMGADIYALNWQSRSDPKMSAPDYEAQRQPIRNGDSGNLALSLLGLPAIPGSSINALQDLHTH